MYKTNVVRSVAKETRLSQRIVGEVLSSSLDVITAALRDGGTVVLPGFGTFYTRERQASQVRSIRNPGELLDIPAMRQADFRVGELLRQAVRKAPRRRSRRHSEGTDGTA